MTNVVVDLLLALAVLFALARVAGGADPALSAHEHYRRGLGTACATTRSPTATRRR